ncbi:MAG: BACON domain-containing protein [Bacteroidaceae bacterium]|nr:BACON domain-containing protein [Bacteroidaceae bacterium]
MKKYLFLILPLVAMLFMSCEKEISLELINSSYVTPADGVIPAEGGEIVIKVASTHSFKMTSPSSAFSFFKEGIVNYSQEGVAVVETEHTIHVDANETDKERHMYIVATQLHNQDIATSLVFLQPAKQEE